VNIGANHVDCDLNWAAAKAEFGRALELDPRDARAWGSLGNLALLMGDIPAAIKHLTTAADLDPLRPPTYEGLRDAYWIAGRPKDAESAARKVLELAPDAEGDYAQLGLILFSQGRVAEALASIERDPDEQARLVARGLIYHKIDRRAEGDKALTELTERHHDDAMDIADVYAELGQADHAFEWLQNAYEQHPAEIAYIKVDPFFKDLHADPRYKAFLRKMNLPE
jgi:adenylate cyclase